VVRTKQLIAIGIDSIELLAAAEPADVMHVKGILPKLAANFIAQARQILETRRPGK
jgi:predicted RecB family nuclease